MTRYIAPNAASYSEFDGIPPLNGDCGPTMLLMLLHCYDPNRFPLTRAGLGAFAEQIIGWGLAGSNGAMDLGQASQVLTRLGIPHTAVNADYSQPAGACMPQLTAALRQMFADGKAGKQLTLVGMETSLAHVGTAGVPDDEAGVYNHYWGFVGADNAETTGDGKTGGYLRVDGDSRYDNQAGLPTPPILTSLQAVASAAPWGFLLIPPFQPVKEVLPPMWTIERDASGITGATDQNGAHIGAGIALEVEQKALLNTDSLIPAGEVYDDAGVGIVALSNGDVLTWHSGAVHDNEAAQVVATLWPAYAARGAHLALPLEAIQAAHQEAIQTIHTPGDPQQLAAFEGTEHRTQAGDTLPSIADMYYGTPALAGAIFDANRDKLISADQLSTNVVLTIPPVLAHPAQE